MVFALRVLGFLGLCGGPCVGQAEAQQARADTSVLGEARLALEARRPFLATRTLAPLLARESRDPDLVLLAARAAAGWEGWGTVTQLLGNQSWLDTVKGGEGRAMLARARVEQSEPAIEDARLALLSASPDNRGFRLVVLARAFDRADQLDSAGARYLEAASELPTIAEWLLLRAAGVTPDSAARTALLRNITLPAAAARIAWTDALARDRAGDYRGAAIAYTSLKAPLLALRMRLRADSTSPPPSLRGDLLALIAGGIGGDDLRAAITMLDETFQPLTTEEDLLIARRIAAVDPRRAIPGFARADSAHLLTDSDRLAFGIALGRVGRHRDAMRQLDEVRSEDLIAQARYQHARTLLALGQRGDAMRWLREIFVTTPGRKDTATFAMAGFLAGELLVDNGNDVPAREVFRQVAERFPRTSHGVRAGFQVGVMDWIAGNKKDAATQFALLADRRPEHGETVAAMYWSGRALWDLGDTARANDRWRAILRRYPSSYYALQASERLGSALPPLSTGSIQAIPDTTWLPAFERAALLERLGLQVEARFEYDRLARAGETSPATRLGLARMFLDRGMVGRAFRLAQPVTDASDRSMTYPLEAIPALREEAGRADVDPFLAAALIRQESLYDLDARSRADARGWMQVMPSLGASLARREGIRQWDVDLLHQPEINLQFGMMHLAEVLKRYPSLPMALAAYNAGARAAESWAGLPGAGTDTEVFIERIQYVETRDYVRRILRNLANYRSLYPSAGDPALRPSDQPAHLGWTRLHLEELSHEVGGSALPPRDSREREPGRPGQGPAG